MRPLVLLLLPALAAAEDFEVMLPGYRFEKSPTQTAQVKMPLHVDAESKLTIYFSTENPYFKDAAHRTQLKKDVAAIFAGNDAKNLSGLAKEVVLVTTSAELETAKKGLAFADGIVELTDESFGMNPSMGTTYNYFYAKVYVGKATPMGGTGTSGMGQTVYYPAAYNYAYGAAHEFLHQLVAKAGMLMQDDVSFYVPEYGHLNDGGLLTDASDSRLWVEPSYKNALNRPKTPGTGIEAISDVHRDPVAKAVFVSRHASGLAWQRLQQIMGRAGATDYGF